jgi:hypothetical protein
MFMTQLYILEIAHSKRKVKLVGCINACRWMKHSLDQSFHLCAVD